MLLRQDAIVTLMIQPLSYISCIDRSGFTAATHVVSDNHLLLLLYIGL